MKGEREIKSVNVYPHDIQFQLIKELKKMTGLSLSQLYVKAMAEYIKKNSDEISAWMEGNKKAQ